MGFIKDYKYQSAIIAVRETIKENKDDIEFVIKQMDKLYQFMKNIAPEYADKNRNISDDFRHFVILLYKNEKQLPLHFILNNQPDFELNQEVPRITADNLKDKDEEEIVKYIVYRVRSFMAAAFTGYGNQSEVDLGKVDLLGSCNEASYKVKFICDALGLYSNVAIIAPAFFDEYNIYERGNNHAFAVVQIGTKQYLIDLTYSQFFQLRGNNFNRLGIPFLGGCDVGLYMSLTEERRQFAENLMRYGYFEVTDENVKLYFDGFSMSYRNGLYYEKMPEIIYETAYTAQDYLNFIAGKDNQMNRENHAFLGRQKKILQNPQMSFQPNAKQR